MIDAMRVAVIDIGSNTARLLVADVDGALESVREERTYLGLAADILRHGSVSPAKLDDAATVAGRYARLAARLDADAVAAVVTAPGRQGRASAELVAALTKAVGGPVRVLRRPTRAGLPFSARQRASSRTAASSPSATSAAARPSSLSALSCSGRPGSAPRTSAR